MLNTRMMEAMDMSMRRPPRTLLFLLASRLMAVAAAVVLALLVAV
jgi:hypothetical protein